MGSPTGGSISDSMQQERAQGEGTLSRGSVRAAEAALEVAREAQAQWAERTLEQRCAILLACRDALMDQVEAVVEAVVAGTGKPRFEALLHEVLILADTVGYYAKTAPRILAPEVIEMHLLRYRRSYLHYSPRGVVAVITPWNLPLIGPYGVAVPALLAGNAVVLKPSEFTSEIVEHVRAIFIQAGLPAEVLQIVRGGPEQGRALIESRPDFVSFTGTTRSGREVAVACGSRLLPHSLHLSGNGAAIVMRDADIDRTVNAITFGAFAHSGQLCMRVQRVYVVDEIRDEFVQKLVDNIKALRAGDAEAHDTDLGRLTRLEDLLPLAGIVEDAVDHGATLVLGGSAREEGEPGFAPTLLTGCTGAMKIVREEVLGPILGIQSISSAEDALQQINDSEAGLIGYVFTKDRLAGRRLAERMRCGTVMVNDVLSAFATPEVPFGGLRASGMGHRHGDLGLRAMCELRHVSYDRVAMTRDVIWFPYTKRGYEAVSKAARILFRSGSPMKKLLDLF